MTYNRKLMSTFMINAEQPDRKMLKNKTKVLGNREMEISNNDLLAWWSVIVVLICG
jgi:hypothetical protein